MCHRFNHVGRCVEILALPAFRSAARCRLASGNCLESQEKAEKDYNYIRNKRKDELTVLGVFAFVIFVFIFVAVFVAFE